MLDAAETAVDVRLADTELERPAGASEAVVDAVTAAALVTEVVRGFRVLAANMVAGVSGMAGEEGSSATGCELGVAAGTGATACRAGARRLGVAATEWIGRGAGGSPLSLRRLPATTWSGSLMALMATSLLIARP